MGLRFQRRIKLFGGLGLNFSKSGISSSIRGPGGSVGTKRYSIRTGIFGLTYVGGYGKKKRKEKYYYDHADDSKSLGPITSVIITIISLAIVLYIGYIIIDFIFPSYTFAYKIIAYIIVGIPILYFILLIIISLFSSNKVPEHTKDIALSNLPVSLPIVSKKKYLLNIDFGYILTITNICAEIESIFFDYQSTHSTRNPFFNTISFPNATENTLNTIPIFDICKSFYFLGLEINEEKDERDILLLCIGFFMSPKIEYDTLSSDITSYNKIISLAKEFIFSINPLSPDQLLIGPVILEYDKSIKMNYISKLKELIGVLTTLDFVLNTKEKELLKILKNYQYS